MSTFRTLLAACLLAALFACSAFPSLPLGSAQAEERAHDGRYSIWVRGAKGSVWARLRTLQVDSALVRSLEQACRAGKQVEVLVWAGSEAAARSMHGSCMRIWVTNHPDVARLPDTLLVDADTLVIHGNLDDFQGARSRNEYRMQAHVKQTQAYLIN